MPDIDDDYSVEYGDDEETWGCLFPDFCCMLSPHLESECVTAEMMEVYYDA